MPFVPVITACAVTTACDSTPTRSLGELPGKSVSLEWSPIRDNPGAVDVYISLSYQLDECVAVDATAKLDDVFTRGSSAENPHGNSECIHPGWTGIVPAGDPMAATTIEIEDESTAITYELTNPFAERTIRASTGGSIALSPAGCFGASGVAGELVLPPNQEVTLSWSPATVLIDDVVLIGHSAASEQLFRLVTKDFTASDSTLRFIAPASAAQAARASLAGTFAPATLRCEGADACSTVGSYCGELTVKQP
jgi:hypothetical protein